MGLLYDRLLTMTVYLPVLVELWILSIRDSLLTSMIWLQMLYFRLHI